jgi:hypothetical protein
MTLLSWFQSLGSQGQVLLVTLLVVIWYTVETHRVASAAVEQAESTHKPFIVPIPIPEYSGEIEEMAEDKLGKVTLRLKNIGTGPALNIRYHVFPDARAAGTLDDAPFVRPLAQGEEFDTGFPVRELRDPASFKATYESLSGRKYQSRVAILERKHLKDFSFAKL